MVGKCKGEVRYLFSRHVAFANKSLGQSRRAAAKIKKRERKKPRNPVSPHPTRGFRVNRSIRAPGISWRKSIRFITDDILAGV